MTTLQQPAENLAWYALSAEAAAGCDIVPSGTYQAFDGAASSAPGSGDMRMIAVAALSNAVRA